MSECKFGAHTAGHTGSLVAGGAAALRLSLRRCRACGITKPIQAFPPLRYREDGTVRQPTECRSCLAARERARRAARLAITNDLAATLAAVEERAHAPVGT